MKIITELNNAIEMVQEQNIFLELDDLLSENKYNIPDSNVTNIPQDIDLDKAFDIAIQRLEAAKRAVPLANKLKDPQQRSEQASRVFMNMNRLQGLVSDIVKMLKTQLSINNDTIQRSKFF